MIPPVGGPTFYEYLRHQIEPASKGFRREEEN
jgi:hypothetical protein